MDDPTPTEGDNDDLARRVTELEATVARLTAALEARPAAPVPPLADLLAGLDQTGSVGPADQVADATAAPTPGSDAGGLDGAGTNTDDAVDGRVDRRRLITRAGAMAAGAVLGGAAATVATASPAAAATGSFDSADVNSPALTATNTGGGTAIVASSLEGIHPSRPTLEVHSDAGTAIKATSNAMEDTTAIDVTTSGAGLRVHATSFATAIAVDHEGPGIVSVAIEAPEFSVGVYGLAKNFGVLGQADDPEGIGISGGSEGGIAGVAGVGKEGAVGGAFSSLGGIGTRTVGSQAQLSFRAEGAPTMAPPPSRTDAHEAGEVYFDDAESLWLCVTSGTPGTWLRLAGPATTGALTVLPSPVRVYDSRPGQPPFVAPQTKLPANTPRTGIALTAASSGIPTDATAAILTATVANTGGGSPTIPGFLTLYATGVPTPTASTLNWTTPGAVIATTTTVALGPAATITALANYTTDLIIDAIAYYR